MAEQAGDNASLSPRERRKLRRDKQDAAPAVLAEVERVVEYPGQAASRAVRPHRPQLRHYAALASFLLAVLLPTALTVGYLYTRAADQYASDLAFSVRGSDSALPTGLFGAFMQNVSAAGADAEIVYEFVRSQQMIEAAMQALPLAEMYNVPEHDFVFRLGENRAVEDVVSYWNWMTDISFDAASGIVRFQARAFTPEDAQRIAEFVLAESTRIVNDLSEQAREDSLRVSRAVVGEAEDRLREARRAMREFRDLEQEVDPAANAGAQLGLIAELEQQLAQARVALDSELQLVGARSPRLETMRQRIASLERQIVEERARVGAGGLSGEDRERRLAAVLSDYEERQVDLEFAQQAYVSALAAHEQAQIEARRQSRFLAPHIEPTRSIEPQYPHRMLISAAVFGLLIVLWSVALLIFYNIRERR